MGGVSLHPEQPEGRARRTLDPSAWLSALVQRHSGNRERPHSPILPDGRDAAGWNARAGPCAGAREALMAQAYRFPKGGRIDRSKPIAILFNGKSVEGYEGDTLASALVANGTHLVARSFKYHRPRGIVSHGSEEPNALMQIDRGRGRADPNNRAPVVEAFQGLRAESQNHWPSLDFDVGEVNDVLSPVFVAGFYYK